MSSLRSGRKRVTGSPDGKASLGDDTRKRTSAGAEERSSPNNYPPPRGGQAPHRENTGAMATRASNAESKNTATAATQKASKVSTVSTRELFMGYKMAATNMPTAYLQTACHLHLHISLLGCLYGNICQCSLVWRSLYLVVYV